MVKIMAMGFSEIRSTQTTPDVAQPKLSPYREIGPKKIATMSLFIVQLAEVLSIFQRSLAENR